MNILEERDKRTKYRKECKKVFDAKFDFAVAESGINPGPVYRLLDEGVVTYADGSPMMYIMKGTLAKALAKMAEDAAGYINYGHHDFAEDPLSLVGTWSKSDYIINESGNDDGRQVLDVVPHFNENNIYLRELKAQGIPVGLSAEFYASYNEKLTDELYEELGEYVPVVDDIELLTFAVVGECGNVNSSDISLSAQEGEDVMSIKELIKQFMADNASEETTEEVTPEETSIEETTEEVATEETSEEQISDEQTSEEETSEEQTSEEPEVSEEDVEAFCQYLVGRIEELEGEVENLRSKLTAETDKHNKFMQKMHGLKLSIGNSEQNEVPTEKEFVRYSGTDGIGE